MNTQPSSTTNSRRLITNERGAVLIVSAVILAGIIVLATFLWRRVGTFVYTEMRVITDEQVLALAEAGVDKAIWSLNQNASYTGETATPLGNGEFHVTVTTINSDTRRIVATGYIPNSTDPIAQQTIQVEALRSGSVVTFLYGMQAGEGGIILNNNNHISGSVYSNGTISANNNSSISGDVWVASNINPSPVASHETENGSYQFGHNTSIRDVAQSFVPSTTGPVGSVSVYLRKVGAPANLTVRLVTNSGGNPTTTQLAQGTLNASWVTTSLQWVSVQLSSQPTLNAGQTYWLILDGNNNANNYYQWGADTDLGYSSGSAKYASNWSSGSWTAISSHDLNFRVFSGGTTTSFLGSNNVSIGGDLHAHTINNVSIAGSAYYQSISGSTAANYYPGSSPPPLVNFPISQAQIEDWKQEAEAGGTHSGNYTTCSSSLGPHKITGNLTLNNNCTLTVTGTLWVQGDLVLNNNNIMRLDSSYGGNGGVVVVTGRVYLNNSNQLRGSGQGDSYLLVVSELESDSPPAIELNNNNVAEGILYAPNGKIYLNNSSEVLELSGRTIELNNNVNIVYEAGLANATFGAGGSSSWAMRDGTWRLVD